MTKKHIVVAMTGASGAALGIQTLRILRAQGIESHLILSDWARRTIELETDLVAKDVTALADHVYQTDDLSATISSGSFHTDGMIVIPCSMKTLSAIANGFSYSLIARAADKRTSSACIGNTRNAAISNSLEEYANVGADGGFYHATVRCLLQPPRDG